MNTENNCAYIVHIKYINNSNRMHDEISDKNLELDQLNFKRRKN